MKKTFILIFLALALQLLAIDNELPYDNLFLSMAADKALPVDKRLDIIDSLLANDPSNTDLLVKKWDLAMRNGYFYRGHEALSKLYIEKYDSFDVRWKCYLLSRYSVALAMVGRYERSAAIAVKLLQLEKPDSLKRFDLDAYMNIINLEKELNRDRYKTDLEIMRETYQQLKERKFLDEYWQRTFGIVLLKSDMLRDLWDKKYDSLLMKSNWLLELAENNNDTTVAMVSRAMVYEEMDRKDMAENIYKALLNTDQIHFNTSLVVLNYMDLLNGWGRYKECVDLLNTYHHRVEVSSEPLRQAEILRIKAEALGKLGRFEEADSIYRKVIEIQQEYNNLTEGLMLEDLANYNMEGLVATKLEAEHTIARQGVALTVLGVLLAAAVAFGGALWWQRRRVRAKEAQAQRVLEQESARTDQKQRELTSMSLQLLNLHELLARMEEQLADRRTDDAERLSTLQSLVREAESTDSTWDAFKQYFEDSHHGFIGRLMKAHPSLSENDVKVCAFMVLNFNTKDIATLTHRSVRTVETIKYRLHKKLGLSQGRNTLEYLRSEFIVIP